MKTRVLALTSISHFINDGNTWVLPTVYGFMTKYLGFSNFIVGLIGTVFFVLSALASPLVSYIADKTGKPMESMGLGIILWGIGLILLGFSLKIDSLPLVFLSTVIVGIASAFYHPLGAAALALTYQGSGGSALGINGAMGSLGRSLYPYITLVLFTIFNKNMMLDLVVIGVVSIIAALPSFTVKISFQQTKAKASTTAKASTYAVGILTLISLFRSIFTNGVSQFLTIILLDILGFSYNAFLGEVMTGILAAAIVGQPLLGYLSDIAGRRLLQGISTGGAVISFLLFIYLHNIWFLPLFGFFTFSNFSVTLSLTSDLVPRNSTGLANALVWGLGVSGGGALGPFIVGLLSDHSGLVQALLIVSVFGLISALMTPLIPRPPKRSKVPLFG